jgi:hypothetical protein
VLFGPIFSLLTVAGLVAIFIWMIQLFIRLMRLARGASNGIGSNGFTPAHLPVLTLAQASDARWIFWMIDSHEAKLIGPNLKRSGECSLTAPWPVRSRRVR